MPRGYYDRKKKAKTPVPVESPIKDVARLDITNLVLQNGDREMMKALLSRELSLVNKQKAKIEKLLEQLPV
jgi:hypothetical protein